MEYKNKWLCSYETLLFNTADGDLGLDEYAIAQGGYYIRTKPKNEAHWEAVIDKDKTYDVSGLTKVRAIGKAYYDEFLTAEGAKLLWEENSKYGHFDELPAGCRIRIRSTAKKYWDVASVKDYPLPVRTEIVVSLPPVEPLPIPSEHHSIAYDATSNSGSKAAVTSYSFNHTCGATADLLVFGDGHYTSAVTVTGVTYNSVAMTSIQTDSDGVGRSSLFYLLAPGVGSALAVAVTYSAESTYAGSGVVSYSGAKQAAPDAHNGGNSATWGDSGTPITISVTTVADNCWVVSVISAYYNVQECAAVTGTKRFGVVNYQAGAMSDTNAPKTPAGAQAMTWTSGSMGGTDYYASISAASFAPFVAPLTVHPLLTLGVGD